jgi:glycosyltransferase involved in cell wall biosynthesis
VISIIIPTYNRAKELGENLYRLIGYISEPDLFEIIVVDNGSKDNTPKVIEKLSKASPEINFKYTFDPEPGLLTGRHRGYQESSGSILVFIDDDILISETWLPFLKELQNSHLDFSLFTGPTFPIYSAYPPEWLECFWRKNHLGRECSWLSLMDFGNETKEIPLSYVWGLNFVIRRDAFRTAGGFNPDNIPIQYQHFQGDGETGLAMKAKALGYKALYDDRLMVFHQISHERLTKNYFGKRAYYQGVCDSFTKLREQNLLADKGFSDNRATAFHIAKRNWKGRLVDQFPLFGLIARLVKSFSAKPSSKCQVENNSEYLGILQYTKEQYKLGFEFHQNAFRSNSLVREWVLRDNYWDYKIPQKND